MMTDKEKDEIIAKVLSTLRAESTRLDTLAPLSSVNDGDMAAGIRNGAIALLPVGAEYEVLHKSINAFAKTVKGIQEKVETLGEDVEMAWQELFRDDGGNNLTQRVATLENDVADKQTTIVDTDDIVNQGDGELALSITAQRRMFNLFWIKAGALDGEQVTSVELGKELPYECNGVRMSFDRAAEVLLWHDPHTRLFWSCAFQGFQGPTLLPLRTGAIGGTTDLTRAFYGCKNIEAIRFVGTTRMSAGGGAFGGCTKLRTISGILDVEGCNLATMFDGCNSLQEVRLKGLSSDVSFAACPSLSLATFEYMVHNAAVPANGTVMIEVHPDIFALVSTPDYGKWSEMADDAAAKGIYFSTL